ncbi:hypothetical protein EDB89DRAFT_2063635 [Lactarius sanguifluus]|nr:hypothetical protein EDB89DRAFT_2063635 [Lactarius sanguifluus]
MQTSIPTNTLVSIISNNPNRFSINTRANNNNMRHPPPTPGPSPSLNPRLTPLPLPSSLHRPNPPSIAPRAHRPHTHSEDTQPRRLYPLRGPPLRPAIKKKGHRTSSASANGTLPVATSLSRTRTHSGVDPQRLHPIARTRTNSSSRVDPDHVFMSINPPNGLELSNLAFQSTVDELREHIFPMWPPGVAHQVRHGYDWRVRFTGSPWDSRGHESIMAQKMICRIFWVLAVQGYVYLTSINTGCAFKSPRLVFIRAPVDARAHFFAMSLNNAGDRVTFVNPPVAVANSLGLSLRTAFPHRIDNEQTSEDGIFTIILKSGIHGMGPDKNLFLAHILKYINDMAFKLDASVPLARRGLFGLSGRKELWVFKGSESWWSTNRK